MAEGPKGFVLFPLFNQERRLVLIHHPLLLSIHGWAITACFQSGAWELRKGRGVRCDWHADVTAQSFVKTERNTLTYRSVNAFCPTIADVISHSAREPHVISHITIFLEPCWNLFSAILPNELKCFLRDGHDCHNFPNPDSSYWNNSARYLNHMAYFQSVTID